MENTIEIFEKYKFTGIPLNDKAEKEDKLNYMNGVLKRAINEVYEECEKKFYKDANSYAEIYDDIKNREHERIKQKLLEKDFIEKITFSNGDRIKRELEAKLINYHRLKSDGI